MSSFLKGNFQVKENVDKKSVDSPETAEEASELTVESS